MTMPRPPANGGVAPPQGGPGARLPSRARMPAVQQPEPQPPTTTLRLASGHYLRVVRPVPADIVGALNAAAGTDGGWLPVVVREVGRSGERAMLLSVSHVEAIETPDPGDTGGTVGFPPEWNAVEPQLADEPGDEPG